LRHAGASEAMALLESLRHLPAANADTNLISRGGPAGLEYVRQRAGRLLAEGCVLAAGGLEQLTAFDENLIVRG